MGDVFSHEESLLIIKLVLAHLTGDFILQSDKWVIHKKNGLRSYAFYLHLGIIAALSWMAVGQVTGKAIGIVAFITVTHGLIDLWKISVDKEGSLRYLLLDQLLHGLVLLVSWLLLINGFGMLGAWGTTLWNSRPVMLITLGYLFCIFPSSIIIRLATRQMITQDHEGNVKRGGRLIGIFERLIIFTFVLLSQYEAIGFLITGKSILRFADGQKKETEYVLVGTMISYALAILAGALVNVLLQPA